MSLCLPLVTFGRHLGCLWVALGEFAKETLFENFEGVDIITDKIMTQILKMDVFSKESFQKNVKL